MQFLHVNNKDPYQTVWMHSLISVFVGCMSEGIFLNVVAFVLGPVVQSVVSLTSSLRVISLIVLEYLIYNILIYSAEKM